MPKCVVTKCPHQTGKKHRYPEIVLHPFPKEIKLIQTWLRLAGMEEENVGLVSLQILEDRRADKFRMCSAHFTQDSYVSKGTKRVLKGDARPSKFPEKTVFDFAQPPMMHRIAKRAQIEQSRGRTRLDVKVECSCKCHTNLKARLVNASTQTESSDFLHPALFQPEGPISLYLGPNNGDYVALGLLGQQFSTTDNIMVSPLDLSPTKPWERTDFHIKQEEAQFNNDFPSFVEMNSVVDGSLLEKPRSDNRTSIVDKIQNLTKQENTQPENSLENSENASEKDATERTLLQNMERYLITIKEENENVDLRSEQRYTEPEESIASLSSYSQKPNRNTKGNRVRIRKEDSGNENGRRPDQCTSSSTDFLTETQTKTPKPTRSKCSKSEEVGSWPMEKHAKEKKYVVYESCLDVLLLNMSCQQNGCCEKIRELDKRTVGSLLVVSGTCHRGHHSELWESQPRVNGIGAGNVLLTALLILTGLSVTKTKALCDMMALQIFSESSHLRLEDAFILPNIHQWMEGDG